MNNSIKFNQEKGMYALAILLALVVRLAGLGSLPLSDPEAKLAMQSLDLVRGQGSALQAEPGYMLLTSSIFYFSQASNFAARIWPAILGAMLPFSAYFLRRFVGVRPAIILSFGLALDPGFVAIGRQVNGTGIAVPLVLLSVALLLHAIAEQKQISVREGIFAGLALLGGASLWPGLLGIGFACLVSRWMGNEVEFGNRDINWKMFGLGAAGALVVVGTLLMTAPIGLGGIGSSLGVYLGGWGSSTQMNVSPLQLLVMLPVYHFLALIFGGAGFIRALFDAEDKTGKVLGGWFFAALLLALIYPARQVTDLAWVLVPLWILAARELARIRLVNKEHGWTELGFAILVILLSIFLVWSYARIPNPAYGDSIQLQQSVVRLAAGFFLLLLTFGLVFWGWGFNIASSGFRLGIMVVLMFFTLSVTINGSGMSGTPETEMWRTGALPKEEPLLRTTLDDLSSWKHKTPDKLDVAVVGLDSDSLRWELRDYLDVRYLNAIAIEDTPSVVITSQQTYLAQSSAYRGQDFVWWSKPAWSNVSAYEFVQWMLFRKVAVENQNIIVWVRSDVFPGSASNSNLP